MENKNYDLKLAGYIWSILKTQPVIVMSWGVDMDTIKPVKGGLEFHVQGFKHTGMVQIILDEGKDSTTGFGVSITSPSAGLGSSSSS